MGDDGLLWKQIGFHDRRLREQIGYGGLIDGAEADWIWGTIDWCGRGLDMGVLDCCESRLDLGAKVFGWMSGTSLGSYS